MNFLNNISAVLNQSLHERSRYKNVVDPKNNNEITIVSYKKNETPMDSCCITMNEFKEGEQIAKLPCNHYFSKDAIMEWITKEKAECPICRFKLSPFKFALKPTPLSSKIFSCPTETPITALFIKLLYVPHNNWVL